MPLRSTWQLIRDTFRDFSRDHGMMLAAALAFYTALSFAPVLLLLIWGTSSLAPHLRDSLLAQINAVLGAQAAEAARIVEKNASARPEIGTLAGVLSIVVLVVSATTVFTQLQRALNQIWGASTRRRAFRGLLYRRLMGLAVLVAVLILLFASVTWSTVVGWLENAGGVAPLGGAVWRAINFGGTLVLFTGLFALVFKFLPDVKHPWKPVCVGAALTAVLFSAGKIAASLYLGYSAIGSFYGAAGALVIMLLWVYYNWAIVLLGAEFTHTLATRER